MSTANHRFKEQYLFVAAMLLLILLIMAGLLVVEWAENKRFLETQRQSVVEKASTIRVRLEALLNTDLLLAQSLIIEVATNKDITQDRFYKIADYFMEASHHIRNIGLAKGTVLTYVYPEKGNEKAIGLDYKKIPSQWPAVQRTIEGRKTVVAGPLNLVQGGIGIIGRTPIFVDTDNAGSETEEYFGLLSEVVDLPSMLETAGLDNKESPLKISIRGKDGLGAEGEVFYGPEELFTKEPVLMKVTLPGGGSWLMASVPVNGWEAKSPYNINYRIIAMVVGLIILFMFCNQQREMTRRKNAEKAREELIMELQKALSEVKQLSGLLPICASCKKIREDSGYWTQIEAYVQDHSEVEFSHGICPECEKKLYPEFSGKEHDEEEDKHG